jgi:hypothetical protein
MEDNGFRPLVHDLLKTLSTLAVIETLLFLFNSDPLLDKIFVRLTLYNIIGLFFFYFVVDKLIGMGSSCPNACPEETGLGGCKCGAKRR